VNDGPRPPGSNGGQRRSTHSESASQSSRWPRPTFWPRPAAAADEPAGVTALHALIAEHLPEPGTDLNPGAPNAVVGIETDRGPWVAALILGSRVLAEFGDDPCRFVDARARKNYAGTSPITKASGTRRVVLARYARNRRLAEAMHQWAFCAIRGSPGARNYDAAMRARGIGHQAAIRQLSNRLVGILHGCLKTGSAYNEHTAWGHHTQAAA
jgi:Transposase IS116/IS110/IS902 family